MGALEIKKNSQHLKSIHEESLKESIPKYQPIKILVAEESQTIRCALGEMLTNLGCLGDFAPDGKTALALYQPHYHLILMDIRLPDFDGITVAQTIRSIERDKKVPIVAMTSYNDFFSYREKCLLAGMDGYSLKPNQWQLQALIEQYVSRS